MCRIDSSKPTRSSSVLTSAELAEIAASARATIEFLRDEKLPEGEPARVTLAVSDCGLADLVGLPQLIRTVERPDGTREFRYRLSGSLCNHTDPPAASGRGS